MSIIIQLDEINSQCGIDYSQIQVGRSECFMISKEAFSFKTSDTVTINEIEESVEYKESTTTSPITDNTTNKICDKKCTKLCKKH